MDEPVAEGAEAAEPRANAAGVVAAPPVAAEGAAGDSIGPALAKNHPEGRWEVTITERPDGTRAKIRRSYKRALLFRQKRSAAMPVQSFLKKFPDVFFERVHRGGEALAVEPASTGHLECQPGRHRALGHIRVQSVVGE